jgi:LysR family transcriptional regulator for bpeEF and oprC
MAFQYGIEFEEAACFVAVVEAGGFSAAARSRGARKATLSRRVQSLERRIGVQLMVRTTRSIRLTDEGRAYFSQAQRAVALLGDAEKTVAHARAEPSGVLRVSATAALAGMMLEPVVVAYLRKHPRVSVELDTSARRVDLVREGFDLALRVGALPDSSLVAQRLGTARGGYFASPAYLRRHGEPESPDDLQAHDAVVIPAGAGPPEWPFVHGGQARSVVVRPRLVTENFELAVRAAIEGLGVLRAPDYFVREAVRERKLRAVLGAFTPPEVQVSALVPPGGMLAPRTRAFVALLTAYFRRLGGPA